MADFKFEHMLNNFELACDDLDVNSNDTYELRRNDILDYVELLEEKLERAKIVQQKLDDCVHVLQWPVVREYFDEQWTNQLDNKEEDQLLDRVLSYLKEGK